MYDSAIPSTIADLVIDLRTYDPASTESVIAQLQSIGTPAIPWLLIALKVEHTTQGRLNLGKALGRIGKAAWEPLLTVARENDDVDFGWSVAWAMQRFENVCTADEFLAALQHPNVHVRWASALALGSFAEERVVAPLIAALAEDGPVTHRHPREAAPENYYRKVGLCAATSLRRLGPLSIPALLTALHSENVLVRAGAANALTGTDDPQVFEPLVVATDDRDANVRRYAIEAIVAVIPALEIMRQLKARNVLVQALFAPDQMVQTVAVKGLCALGKQSAVPLIALVQERQWDIDHPLTRAAAISALACLFAQEPPIPALEQQLFPFFVGALADETNPQVLRSAAAKALGKTRNAAALAALLSALTDPSPILRGGVAEALRTLGDSRALPALQEALRVAHKEADAFQTSEAVDIHDWLVDELEETVTGLATTLGE